LNSKKVIGAIVYKLEDKSIIENLIDDNFDIIKLNDNDSYVYKDNSKISAIKLMEELRKHGVYVIRRSVVRTSIHSGQNLLAQKSEYLM